MPFQLPSLYVHFPLCASRCSYCDFHTSATTPGSCLELSNIWLESVERHLNSIQLRFGISGFSTVYLGGGTPSIMPRPVLANALKLLHDAAQRGGCEVLEFNVEVNSEDIDENLLEVAAEAGVNRLSVGIQSLEDTARTLVNRRGNAESCKKNLVCLAETWPSRWSADIMYGLPGQTVNGLGRDVRFITSLGAGHVSLYELTVEEKSPLGSSIHSGSLQIPDEDEAGDMYGVASKELVSAGMSRYEVSNWCLTGQECLHNEVYWKMGDWLAVGPSGVGNVSLPDGSFLRIENSHEDDAYWNDPAGTAKEYTISGRDAIFEYFMTALRTKRGLSFIQFKARFSLEPFEVFGLLHERFKELIVYDGCSWLPTDRGLDLLNLVLLDALRSLDKYFPSGASLEAF